MERRKFISLGALAVIAATVPSTLSAIDYRKTKPKAWAGEHSHTVKEAMKELYGTTKTIQEGVKLKVPKVASNGGAIPVGIKSKLEAKSVAIFQDTNPESLVAVFTLNENSIIDYSLKMKMKGSGTITVVVEANNGRLYSASQSLEVALGGCEG